MTANKTIEKIMFRNCVTNGIKTSLQTKEQHQEFIKSLINFLTLYQVFPSTQNTSLIFHSDISAEEILHVYIEDGVLRFRILNDLENLDEPERDELGGIIYTIYSFTKVFNIEIFNESINPLSEYEVPQESSKKFKGH